jgi:hypothetical protein
MGRSYYSKICGLAKEIMKKTGFISKNGTVSIFHSSSISTTQTILCRVKTGCWKWWQGRWAIAKEVIKDINGIRNVYPAIIIGICGIKASGSWSVLKEIIQDPDAIG